MRDDENSIMKDGYRSIINEDSPTDLTKICSRYIVTAAALPACRAMQVQLVALRISGGAGWSWEDEVLIPKMVNTAANVEKAVSLTTENHHSLQLMETRNPKHKTENFIDTSSVLLPVRKWSPPDNHDVGMIVLVLKHPEAIKNS